MTPALNIWLRLPPESPVTMAALAAAAATPAAAVAALAANPIALATGPRTAVRNSAFILA